MSILTNRVEWREYSQEAYVYEPEGGCAGACPTCKYNMMMVSGHKLNCSLAYMVYNSDENLLELIHNFIEKDVSCDVIDEDDINPFKRSIDDNANW